ncbi:PREDICTED: uncharacterized protein LOC106149293 [Chinchilla lanigera]|uniref:uncharacterized protein LOC106149293 n=1 Tax=Chinchilla lanigera TaxID=34839 RepID=UPI000695C0D3|nr:PREDICTED: uncharacterized protein LOC106149293 [Chinchilla lanigera]
MQRGQRAQRSDASRCGGKSARSQRAPPAGRGSGARRWPGCVLFRQGGAAGTGIGEEEVPGTWRGAGAGAARHGGSAGGRLAAVGRTVAPITQVLTRPCPPAVLLVPGCWRGDCCSERAEHCPGLHRRSVQKLECKPRVTHRSNREPRRRPWWRDRGPAQPQPSALPRDRRLQLHLRISLPLVFCGPFPTTARSSTSTEPLEQQAAQAAWSRGPEEDAGRTLIKGHSHVREERHELEAESGSTWQARCHGHSCGALAARPICVLTGLFCGLGVVFI